MQQLHPAGPATKTTVCPTCRTISNAQYRKETLLKLVRRTGVVAVQETICNLHCATVYHVAVLAARCSDWCQKMSCHNLHMKHRVTHTIALRMCRTTKQPHEPFNLSLRLHPFRHYGRRPKTC